MDKFKYNYSQRLHVHMKQRVLLLTHILVIISIIVLVFAFPVCAEEGAADNSADIPEIIDSVETEVAGEGLAGECVTLFTEILPFDAETVIIIADSGAVHEINAATPLGRLAIAALEGDGFDYVIRDTLFESDGILTLASIENYVQSETAAWKAYDGVHDADWIIADDEIHTLLVAGDVIFVYGNENGKTLAIVEIFAEPLVDEVHTEASASEVVPESAELSDE